MFVSRDSPALHLIEIKRTHCSGTLRQSAVELEPVTAAGRGRDEIHRPLSSARLGSAQAGTGDQQLCAVSTLF